MPIGCLSGVEWSACRVEWEDAVCEYAFPGRNWMPVKVPSCTEYVCNMTDPEALQTYHGKYLPKRISEDMYSAFCYSVAGLLLDYLSVCHW